MKRIVFVLVIILGLFFKLSVYADTIEVSRPPEITEVNLDLQRNVISTTDSIKVNAGPMSRFSTS